MTVTGSSRRGVPVKGFFPCLSPQRSYLLLSAWTSCDCPNHQKGDSRQKMMRMIPLQYHTLPLSAMAQ
ncbi:hypothetical protein VTN96DRAFT_9282 [Rasamsonia emersonii]